MQNGDKKCEMKRWTCRVSFVDPFYINPTTVGHLHVGRRQTAHRNGFQYHENAQK